MECEFDLNTGRDWVLILVDRWPESPSPCGLDGLLREPVARVLENLYSSGSSLWSDHDIQEDRRLRDLRDSRLSRKLRLRTKFAFGSAYAICTCARESLKRWSR